MGAPKAQKKCRNLPYRSLVIASSDVLDKLDDTYTSGFCAWNSRAMRALSALDSFRPASFVRLHSSMEVDVESSAKDVVEVSTDCDVGKKKVTVWPFDPYTCRCEKIPLRILQV